MTIAILHLRATSGLYGADRSLLALASASPAPFAPIVGSIVRRGVPDTLGAEAARLGLSAHTFRSEGRFDLALAGEIARVARRRGAGLLHAHDFKSLFLALLAGAIAGVPVVATYHGETKVTAAVRLYELFARLLGNFTRGAIAVSRTLQDTLSRWVRSAPVAFVPNGLPVPRPIDEAERTEARRALGLAPRALVVAVVGRLSPEKGQDVLLEALRRLDDPPAVLFAGDGPARAELEAKAAGLPVRFLGFVRDPRPVFAAADVVVLPSLTEGLPLVALEAMTLQRCLIASAVGELPELLGNESGLLVPPGDAAALALALEAARDADTRAWFAARALERARAYDDAAMAGAYARLYRSALAPARLASASR